MKTFICFCYAISCVLLGLVLIAYFINPLSIPSKHFNYPMVKMLLICAGITFSIYTPIMFTHMYSSTFNKTEEEIARLKKDLAYSISLFNRAKDKLIEKTIKDGE